ncbi:hypothetical protein Bpfe_024875 [Biomphalaria pfeifferi]|uniref:Uncharacterized protein n=1 Tax=Biomphalaria pfeifferi TaxID=112525 RepID=A0AAD8EZ10_BIOPF|nr:hypothetical protein Bpfe_024875 [Biomphalaria pfeifferi]
MLSTRALSKKRTTRSGTVSALIVFDDKDVVRARGFVGEEGAGEGGEKGDCCGCKTLYQLSHATPGRCLHWCQSDTTPSDLCPCSPTH